MKKKFLILTEASKKIGYGHLSRCIFLSEKLKKNGDITFTSKFNIKEYLPKEFKFFDLSESKNFRVFDCLIIDLRFIDKKYSKIIKKFKIQKKILIYEKKIKSLFPSLTIIPYQLNLRLKDKKIIYGKNALILNPQIARIVKKKRKMINQKTFNISICFGGSDPKNFTLKIVRILRLFKNSNIFLNIIVGNFYDLRNEKKLRQEIRLLKNIKIYRNPKNIYEIFYNSNFAIINSGNIKYELAALGTPFFMIANDRKSKIFCKIFKREFKFFSEKNFNFPKKVYLFLLINYILREDRILNHFASYNRRKIKLNSIDTVTKNINRIIK